MSRRRGLGGGLLLGMDQKEGLAFLRCGFEVVAVLGRAFSSDAVDGQIAFCYLYKPLNYDLLHESDPAPS
jgi:hypothetical protein